MSSRVRRGARRMSLYTAAVQQWATKANLRLVDRNASVSLAHVLAGDTCYPIGLPDFEAFLAFRDHSLENLQFVVWYQDYRKRFFALPQTLQRRSLSPKDPDFVSAISAPSPAYGERNLHSTAHGEKYVHSSSVMQPPGLPSPPSSSVEPPSDCLPPTPISPFAPWSPVSPTSATPFVTSLGQAPSGIRYPSPVNPITQNTNNSAAAPANANTSDQPFRDECMCVLATFLAPSSKKELLLDAAVRDTAMRHLVWTTHPDVFLPMYENIYELVQSVSLPRFLAHASTNINRPKQIYWYFVGTVNMLIGLAIALSLIMCLHTPPQYRRIYRLPSVPFIAVGAAQVYSGLRGFCSKLFARNSVQLRVWEMDEMDREALEYWDDVADVDARPQMHMNMNMHTAARADPCADADARSVISGGKSKRSSTASSKLTREFDADDAADLVGAGYTARPRASLSIDTSASRSARSAIAPFAAPPSTHAHAHAPPAPTVHIAPFVFAREARTRNGFHRPPVFGPEKVVMDARILKVHKEVLAEIMRFGWYCLALTAVVVLSVPGWGRH